MSPAPSRRRRFICDPNTGCASVGLAPITTMTSDFITESNDCVPADSPSVAFRPKPVGEWQTMTAVVVGNRVTVDLNGRRVHDNVAIPAITGGALDANESEPGPIMIQGDHTGVWLRRLVVPPITTPGH